MKSAEHFSIIRTKSILIFHLRQTFWEFRNPYSAFDKNTDKKKVQFILVNFFVVFIQRKYIWIITEINDWFNADGPGYEHLSDHSIVELITGGVAGEGEG